MLPWENLKFFGMSETLVFGILVGFLHYYRQMPSQQNLKEFFGDPPLKSLFFSFDSPFKAIFFMPPPPQIPPAPPPYLMKNEGSLSETKKVTRHFWY